ncbi:N-acetylmuramoyl-L-alanine amidase [Bacillus oleivorans]|uniref:N-acetylmuramoyl-L-alanine amidase n=1 Tax=Bacillus oleivorans TaxID=1448271 RepID=A0A285D714_9BACI|nr:N-acetylmuramoyl-L-alanine amidase CwlD [Bacillus oleivorans]SNX75597.1 N-acetylmuramoyl-L-alanine amidase [Bacillus oleivorans]
MRKNAKWFIFSIGIVVLFFIIQFDIKNDESWDSWNLPLTGKIIYLDPGHGGVDPGASKENVVEKDIALNISLKLRDFLQQQGALVLMTREEDVDLADPETRGYSRRKTEDLHKRLALINESEAEFFLSIHLNAFPSSRWSGAQTFYSPRYKENEQAAKFIQSELTRNLENTTRKAKEINNVFLIKHAEKPGVLVEVGFLSNSIERGNLQNEAYQEMLAASIYKGILRYFSEVNYEEPKDD